MTVELKKYLIKVDKTKSKDGKEHTYVNFFVEFNGKKIAVRPSFDDDFEKLNLIASKVGE